MIVLGPKSSAHRRVQLLLEGLKEYFCGLATSGWFIFSQWVAYSADPCKRQVRKYGLIMRFVMSLDPRFLEQTILLMLLPLQQI